MSDDSSPKEHDSGQSTDGIDINEHETYNFGLSRRDALKAIGATAFTPIVTSKRALASSCATGPTTRTHKGATINTGQITAKQAQSSAPLGDRPRPIALSKQKPSGSSSGISIHNEYDGLGTEDKREPEHVPGDPQIATGQSHHVVAIKSMVAFINKQSGVQRFLAPFRALFDKVRNPALSHLFDPRLRYDHVEDRFVFLAAQSKPSGSKNNWGTYLLGVSDNANPNGKWHTYAIASEVTPNGFPDFPALGLDREAVYLTANTSKQVGVELVILDKADLYAGRDVSASHFTNLKNPDGSRAATVQPSFQPSVSAEGAGTYHLLASQLQANDKLTLWDVDAPVSGPTVNCRKVPIVPYSGTAFADQPGTSARLTTSPVHLQNVAHHDGSLFTAHTVGDPKDSDNAVIKWYEIDPSSATTVQDAFFGQGSGDEDRFMPTVEANGDSMMIVHNVSGPNTFVGVAVAGRTNGFAQNQIEDTVVVQPGFSKYDRDTTGGIERWGDYNGIAVDPHPQFNHYWGVSMYSPDVDRSPNDPFNTRVAEVSF